MKTTVCNLIRLILILAVSASASKQDDKVDEKRNQLDAIRNELASKRALYDSLGSREKNEMAKLRDLEQQVSLSSQLLLKINRKSSSLKKDIAAQRLRLQIAEAKREDRAELLKKRLVYIYKTGDRPAWLELLSSGDPSSWLAAVRNMKSLVEYDRHLVASYHDLSLSLASGLKRFQRDNSELEALKNEQEDELASREKTLSSRKNLMARLKNNRKEVERSISSLESDAKDIAGILERLELESSQAGYDSTLPGLASGMGNLVWPARGKILRQFGLIRDKRGIELSNPGIDIEAKMGTEVLAAASGIVMYVNWLRGYGQFIILDHGQGYYTLYANLSDVFVELGDRVKAGELIALVGDSGSLEGPKLHFEVRHKKDQLNPVEWLR